MTTTDTATADDTTAPDAAGDRSGRSKPKRRSNVVPAAILAIALVACALVLRPSSGGADEPAEEPEAPPGEVVELEPMTLNLGDGHYLRLGVALELVEGVPAAEFEESGEVSRYKDFLISNSGGTDAETLSTPEGREALKKELHDGAEHLYPEEFSEVYLTELVVQ